MEDNEDIPSSPPQRKATRSAKGKRKEGGRLIDDGDEGTHGQPQIRKTHISGPCFLYSFANQLPTAPLTRFYLNPITALAYGDPEGGVPKAITRLYAFTLAQSSSHNYEIDLPVIPVDASNGQRPMTPTDPSLSRAGWATIDGNNQVIEVFLEYENRGDLFIHGPTQMFQVRPPSPAVIQMRQSPRFSCSTYNVASQRTAIFNTIDASLRESNQAKPGSASSWYVQLEPTLERRRSQLAYMDDPKQSSYRIRRYFAGAPETIDPKNQEELTRQSWLGALTEFTCSWFENNATPSYAVIGAYRRKSATVAAAAAAAAPTTTIVDDSDVDYNQLMGAVSIRAIITKKTETSKRKLIPYAVFIESACVNPTLSMDNQNGIFESIISPIVSACCTNEIILYINGELLHVTNLPNLCLKYHLTPDVPRNLTISTRFQGIKTRATILAHPLSIVDCKHKPVEPEYDVQRALSVLHRTIFGPRSPLRGHLVSIVDYICGYLWAIDKEHTPVGVKCHVPFPPKGYHNGTATLTAMLNWQGADVYRFTKSMSLIELLCTLETAIAANVSCFWLGYCADPLIAAQSLTFGSVALFIEYVLLLPSLTTKGDDFSVNIFFKVLSDRMNYWFGTLPPDQTCSACSDHLKRYDPISILGALYIDSKKRIPAGDILASHLDNIIITEVQTGITRNSPVCPKPAIHRFMDHDPISHTFANLLSIATTRDVTIRPTSLTMIESLGLVTSLITHAPIWTGRVLAEGPSCPVCFSLTNSLKPEQAAKILYRIIETTSLSPAQFDVVCRQIYARLLKDIPPTTSIQAAKKIADSLAITYDDKRETVGLVDLARVHPDSRYLFHLLQTYPTMKGVSPCARITDMVPPQPPQDENQLSRIERGRYFSDFIKQQRRLLVTELSMRINVPQGDKINDTRTAGSVVILSDGAVPQTTAAPAMASQHKNEHGWSLVSVLENKQLFSEFEPTLRDFLLNAIKSQFQFVPTAIDELFEACVTVTPNQTRFGADPREEHNTGAVIECQFTVEHTFSRETNLVPDECTNVALLDFARKKGSLSDRVGVEMIVETCQKSGESHNYSDATYGIIENMKYNTIDRKKRGFDFIGCCVDIRDAQRPSIAQSRVAIIGIGYQQYLILIADGYETYVAKEARAHSVTTGGVKPPRHTEVPDMLINTFPHHFAAKWDGSEDAAPRVLRSALKECLDIITLDPKQFVNSASSFIAVVVTSNVIVTCTMGDNVCLGLQTTEDRDTPSGIGPLCTPHNVWNNSERVRLVKLGYREEVLLAHQRLVPPSYMFQPNAPLPLSGPTATRSVGNNGYYGNQWEPTISRTTNIQSLSGLIIASQQLINGATAPHMQLTLNQDLFRTTKPTNRYKYLQPLLKPAAFTATAIATGLAFTAQREFNRPSPTRDVAVVFIKLANLFPRDL